MAHSFPLLLVALTEEAARQRFEGGIDPFTGFFETGVPSQVLSYRGSDRKKEEADPPMHEIVRPNGFIGSLDDLSQMQTTNGEGEQVKTPNLYVTLFTDMMNPSFKYAAGTHGMTARVVTNLRLREVIVPFGGRPLEYSGADDVTEGKSGTLRTEDLLSGKVLSRQVLHIYDSRQPALYESRLHDRLKDPVLARALRHASRSRILPVSSYMAMQSGDIVFGLVSAQDMVQRS